MSDLHACVLGVVEMNNIISSGKGINLEAQVRVVLEEAEELYDSVMENQGETQVLKEAVDVLVTAFGVVQALIERGYDVYGAWAAVNVNNLSKFPEDFVTAKYSQTMLGDDVTLEQDPRTKRYVLKNRQGKAVKPFGYEKVDVSPFVPKELL